MLIEQLVDLRNVRTEKLEFSTDLDNCDSR